MVPGTVNPRPTVFLSHIAEESALALLLKEAVEQEFGGLVDLFSFSADEMNPAGGVIIKNIEKHLAASTGSLFLISPTSIRRPWINFELGAQWMKNLYRRSNEQEDLPLIPVCHSGIEVSTLPAPLSSLNAIVASSPSGLMSLFLSVQKALGGKGNFRTDFDELAKSIAEFEIENTLASAFLRIFSITSIPMDCERLQLIQDYVALHNRAEISLGVVHQYKIEQLQMLIESSLKKSIRIHIGSGQIIMKPEGTVAGAEVKLTFDGPFFEKIFSSAIKLLKNSAD